jgi:hypothetical protein
LGEAGEPVAGGADVSYSSPLQAVHQLIAAEKMMRIGCIEEYTRIFPLEDPAAELASILAQFPYGTVVECDFPEWDVANRWCWQNFGPRHGECWGHVEYATCPLVLPTEHVVKIQVRGKEYELKRYSSVPKHNHVGIWTTHWFGKTEYDHGFGEFCFCNEDHKAKFLEYVPHVDWGENFPWLKDETNE